MSDSDRRCETDGCHRQATKAIEFRVWKGGDCRKVDREICDPCINAMQFRETFTWGDDAWSVRELQTEAER